MWKLLQHATQFGILRYSLSASSKTLVRCGGARRAYVHQLKNTAEKNIAKWGHGGVRNFSFLTKIGLMLSGGTFFKVCVNRASCGTNKSRMVGYHKSGENEQSFDWRTFWFYLKPHLVHFISAIVGALVVAFLNIWIPQVMGNVINVVARFTDIKDSNVFFREMKIPALKLVVMYLTQSLFTVAYICLLSNIGERIAYNMKKDLFASIVRQDIEFFDYHRTGEIVNRLTADIQDFKSSFKQTVSGGLRASMQIIGCSISLVMISPHMTFITLLCVPTVVAVGTAFGAMLRKTSRHAQAQVEKSTAVADEAIGNIRTVRAFAMEEAEKELFDIEAEQAMILNQKLGVGIGLFQGGTNLFLNGMVLATLYMGGYLLSTNQLSPGELMAYLMATQTIQRSLAQLSLLFGSVIRGAASGSRVFEYIKLSPKMLLTGGCVIPSGSLRGDIEFKDVDFVYPTRVERNVLDKFSLIVPAGQTVAIVGASGNGKSTVVALLERFYDVKSGSITIDGHDLRTLDPCWLRQCVLGFISQEPILFATSVMENIRYGKQSATDKEVIEAAKMANAHDFIASFPMGYDTMVGERGAALSGGQKQRIAIARALLKQPKVLILDEATSALDTESEKIVQSALDKASLGRTVIVIAHRLSTIQNADMIVVLSKGRVVEFGTHESLTRLKGYYYSLTFDQHQYTPAG